MNPKSLALLVVTLCAAFSIPTVHAQVAAAGAIVGTVTDPTGAVVPEAEITATSIGTQVKRTTTSNSQGFYDIESLLAELVPKEAAFEHAEGNSDSHIKAMLSGPSCATPVREGKLALGQWQAIFLCEWDGPRTRRVEVGVL